MRYDGQGRSRARLSRTVTPEFRIRILQGPREPSGERSHRDGRQQEGGIGPMQKPWLSPQEDGVQNVGSKSA